jgi:NADH dehydrogenase
MERKPHVVIIGGGFGGLYAARALASAPVEITILDRRNFHLFQPLLYQVATAALNPADIAEPIRAILSRQKNVSVRLAEVTAVDTSRRLVKTSDGEVAYDFAIVATGSTHSYFGRPEWARHAPGLKTIEDALEIRRRVLRAFEEAEHEPDLARQRALLTFVVVGGGPTGVEIAGALAEIARHTMLRDFRHVDPTSARILLVEAQDKVLPSYHEQLSRKAIDQLGRLGVEVVTGKKVTNITADHIEIGGEQIPSHTTVWAAGNEGSPLARTLGVPLDWAGLVIVEPPLNIPGHENVFVVGDLAHVDQPDGSIVPAVAPAAIQEGPHVAKNIRRAIEGKPLLPFRYWDKGSLATIGRAAAVADFGGPLKFGGFFAWMSWLVIHIFFLIGFRNRALVVAQWAWAYFSHERGARLITSEQKEPPACPSCSPTPADG